MIYEFFTFYSLVHDIELCLLYSYYFYLLEKKGYQDLSNILTSE